MSFLAISKKRPVDLPDAEVGMLDVSANALAVLILATMMVLTVAAPPVPRGEIRTDARPDDGGTSVQTSFARSADEPSCP